MKQRVQMNDFVRKAHYAYFHMKLGKQDKAWAPVCKTCVETQWAKGDEKNALLNSNVLA